MNRSRDSTFSGGWVSNGWDVTLDGEVDCFVAKFTENGPHLWSSFLGGGRDDAGYAIVVDASNGIFVSGWTGSDCWIVEGCDATEENTGAAFLVRIIDPAPGDFNADAHVDGRVFLA